MRTKIFSVNSLYGIKTKVEEEINVWLDNNPNIEIIDQKTNSCTVGTTGNAGHLGEIYTVCIFYKK